MKITLPKIEINENEDFSSEKDIFKRKDFGERLISLFENTQEELVVALNAPWGEGKSTFIKMWQNHIKLNQDNIKIKTIYFDAFKNDYQKDPFLAITSEIYSLCNMKEESKKEFIKNAKEVGKSLVWGAFKLGTKLTTAALVDETVLENGANDISSILNDNIEKLIENRIKNHEANKSALDKFKGDLEKFIASEKPIVFIIDELDRCRPDYALELLEQIKHLFSVKNLYFLLVVNSKQLESSIKSKYGNEINAHEYLQKFITLTLELPKKLSEYSNYNETFMDWALNKMLNKDEKIQNLKLIETMKEIAKFYNLSFRKIERILSNIAILHNMSPDTKYYMYYQLSMAFICFIKVENPEVFQLLKNEKSSPDEIFKKIGLDSVPNDKYSEYYLLNSIKLLLIFDYSNQDEKKELLEKDENIKELFYRNYQTNIFKNIIGNLSTLNNR